jgi:ubiquinone/menaquinone biosynthesis C-methylase UbiE
MSDFSTIASFYREKSIVQADAGKQLIELLKIAPDADILDVGCGTGNLTAELRDITSGRVVGIDPSEGMIRQARDLYGKLDIDFCMNDGDGMEFSNEFDTIYCSSTFQWFREPAAALANFAKGLRPGGKVGIQAPATSRYSPNFLAAIARCRRAPRLSTLFAGFRAPWFFLDSDHEYRTLFEQAGFIVSHCRIEEIHQRCSVDKAVDIFNSGAAAGYLNQAYYAEPLPVDFNELVMEELRATFEEQVDVSGEIDLVFYRLFAVLRKTG